MKRYNVICKKCKSVRSVGIVKGAMSEIVDWLDNNPDPQVVKIVSARKRFDGEWGWQCVCGNDDMWTAQESKFIRNKVTPDPQQISDVIKNLKPVVPKFRMVEV